MKKVLKNVSFMILLLQLCIILGQEMAAQNRIVIDVSHGGNDASAIGINGIKEKDVVLDISLEILRLNEKTEVLLDRTKLSKALNADVFIPLHCNHSRRIEVFVGKNKFENLKKTIWFAYQLQNQIKKQLGLESRVVKLADYQVFRERISFCVSAL